MPKENVNTAAVEVGSEEEKGVGSSERQLRQKTSEKTPSESDGHFVKQTLSRLPLSRKDRYAIP